MSKGDKDWARKHELNNIVPAVLACVDLLVKAGVVPKLKCRTAFYLPGGRVGIRVTGESGVKTFEISRSDLGEYASIGLKEVVRRALCIQATDEWLED